MRDDRGGLRLLLALVLAGVAALAAVTFAFPGFALALAVEVERRLAGLEQRSVEAAGHRIEYLAGGSGEALVLLHGFGGDKDNWTRVARHLTGRFRVIAPDLPAFGESSRDPAARYGSFDQVERLRAFLRVLGVESFHLGGNSMGGHLAALYAARHGAEVKSLWLLAPAGVRTARESELGRLVTRGENPLLVDSPESFERLFELCFAEPPWVPRPILRHMAGRAIADRPFHEKIFRDLASESLWLEDVAKDLAVPTLILWGTDDRLLHASGARVLEGVIRGSKVVILPKVGHLPMVERPKESAEAFLAFAPAG